MMRPALERSGRVFVFGRTGVVGDRVATASGTDAKRPPFSAIARDDALALVRLLDALRAWVPAFAGMTVFFWKRNPMTKKLRATGYKRPPKKHCWKKGQSGNPRGRPP